MPDKITVTQADRDLWKSLKRAFWKDAEEDHEEIGLEIIAAHRLAQTDAQMAAPDGPAKRLQEIADSAGFDDVYGIVWPHEHGVVRRDLKAILASLSASNAMRDALEEARLTLAHARVFIGSRQKMHPDGQKLYDEAIAQAEAALAGQGTTLDRQTEEK